MVTREQCSAARGLLGWSQADLAESALIGIVTVRQFETGAHEPRRLTLYAIRRAFEAAGVEFTRTVGAPEYGCESDPKGEASPDATCRTSVAGVLWSSSAPCHALQMFVCRRRIGRST